MSYVQKVNMMDWRDRIETRPDVMVGKPVIKGTRLAVEFIVDLFAQGWTEEAILGNYPGITADDVRACLRYARESVSVERAFPLGASAG